MAPQRQWMWEHPAVRSTIWPQPGQRRRPASSAMSSSAWSSLLRTAPGWDCSRAAVRAVRAGGQGREGGTQGRQAVPPVRAVVHYSHQPSPRCTLASRPACLPARPPIPWPPPPPPMRRTMRKILTWYCWQVKPACHATPQLAHSTCSPACDGAHARQEGREAWVWRLLAAWLLPMTAPPASPLPRRYLAACSHRAAQHHSP